MRLKIFSRFYIPESNLISLTVTVEAFTYLRYIITLIQLEFKNFEIFGKCPLKVCIFFQITDSSDDGSGGDVLVTGGGAGHRFVEVRLTSQIGKGLDYFILAYTDISRSGVNSTLLQ